MAYKTGMKNHSPSGKNQRPDTCIHQRGMRNRSPSAVEPHPKGGSVDAAPTRSEVGKAAPTIGPRAA